MAADATTATAHDDAQTTPRRRRGNPNLKPWTKGDPKASAAGKISAERRRATAAARRTDARNIADALDTVAAGFERSDLGRHAAAVAGYVLGRIAAGQIPIRHADDAAVLLRALVDVARLEEGSATSLTLTAHVGTDDVLALRNQARAAIAAMSSTTSAPALSPSATADPDIPGREVDP